MELRYARSATILATLLLQVLLLRLILVSDRKRSLRLAVWRLVAQVRVQRRVWLRSWLR